MCWDAVAESFFTLLENETYHREPFATRARVRFAVADYIDVFYNRERLHNSLGYRTAARHTEITSPSPRSEETTEVRPRSLTHLI